MVGFYRNIKKYKNINIIKKKLIKTHKNIRIFFKKINKIRNNRYNERFYEKYKKY